MTRSDVAGLGLTLGQSTAPLVPEIAPVHAMIDEVPRKALVLAVFARDEEIGVEVNVRVTPAPHRLELLPRK